MVVCNAPVWYASSQSTLPNHVKLYSLAKYHCRQLARWEAIEISGIVIEGGIFALAIYLVYNIHMNLAPKMKVVALFGTRAMSVPINNLSSAR